MSHNARALLAAKQKQQAYAEMEYEGLKVPGSRSVFHYKIIPIGRQFDWFRDRNWYTHCLVVSRSNQSYTIQSLLQDAIKQPNWPFKSVSLNNLRTKMVMRGRETIIFVGMS